MKTKQIIGLEKLGIINLIRAVNKQQKKRQPLSNQICLEIISEYKEDIDKLSEMLKKDLSNWTTIEGTKIDSQIEL